MKMYRSVVILCFTVTLCLNPVVYELQEKLRKNSYNTLGISTGTFSRNFTYFMLLSLRKFYIYPQIHFWFNVVEVKLFVAVNVITNRVLL